MAEQSRKAPPVVLVPNVPACGVTLADLEAFAAFWSGSCEAYPIACAALSELHNPSFAQSAKMLEAREYVSNMTWDEAREALLVNVEDASRVTGERILTRDASDHVDIDDAVAVLLALSEVLSQPMMLVC